MAADFSWKSNEAKAQAVAAKLVGRFPQGSLSADSLGGLCAFLNEYAGIDYITTMSILNRLAFTEGSPADMLRLAYALVHYEPKQSQYQRKGKYEAHAKIIKVTADRMNSKSPQICLRALLVSSPYAGSLIDFVTPIRDAVKLHKKIYSGRSKSLSGRSLLEFVGSVCTLKIIDDTVQLVDASTEEKKLNKNLCTERAKADTECAKASSCVLCKERRNTCRLAVRY